MHAIEKRRRECARHTQHYRKRFRIHEMQALLTEAQKMIFNKASVALDDHNKALLHKTMRVFATTRGVTRLDGARGKKKVWCPHVRTWGLSEANVLYWNKYFDIFRTFWRLPQSFAAPRVIRRPRNCSPIAPPRYARGNNKLRIGRLENAERPFCDAVSQYVIIE